jgi:hypothetical protein
LKEKQEAKKEVKEAAGKQDAAKTPLKNQQKCTKALWYSYH